jgi:hypothetical protein
MHLKRYQQVSPLQQQQQQQHSKRVDAPLQGVMKRYQPTNPPQQHLQHSKRVDVPLYKARGSATSR